ncbi:PQ-loop repeat-containing protein 1 [Armadillidium vulgare]|nr:PQ-loop repeat-containing protein 1 [Armadillidium vulgare]
MNDFDWKYFWKWTDSQSYIEFMLTFTTVASTFLYILIDYPIFVEFIGFFSLSTESMLGLPQFLKNHSSKSTFGMSRKMVLMWLCGDIFKDRFTTTLRSTNSISYFWLSSNFNRFCCFVSMLSV